MKEIELQSLCGTHKLSGVDMCETTVSEYGYTETVSCVRFILDDVKYEAVENPSDGYRSYMGSLRITDEKVRCTFPPVDVLCLMDECEDNDVLCFRDVANGKTIFRVGTENTYDYYPYCVFDWMPENLNCNEVTNKEIIKAFTGGNGIRIRVDNMIVYVDDLEEWLEFCDKQKSEAIKEFAEKVKAKCDYMNDYYGSDYGWAIDRIHEEVDDLVKEMVGEGK